MFDRPIDELTREQLKDEEVRLAQIQKLSSSRLALVRRRLKRLPQPAKDGHETQILV